ncbi:MAG: M48 family metallopeptidase [Hyphomicrobiaceae bacterium]|nr:M48 family metallopeptidase [Hyphomicrobiaceae bacterium]
MPDSITIAGSVVPVTVRAHPRARRLIMRLDARKRSLRLTVPPGVAARDVSAFLQARTDWIESRLASLPPLSDTGLPAALPLRGACVSLHATGRLRGPIMLEGSTLAISGETAEAARRRLIAFLKREACGDLEEAVARHCAALGVRASAIRIKDTGSRWGSCSSGRVLSFSWRIVLAPPEILSYLAAHEVAHLVHMDHSPAFWKTVARLDASWRMHDRWLKDNGQKLMGAL